VLRIFGLRRNEATGGWRKLHNEELRDLYSSPSIIRKGTQCPGVYLGHPVPGGYKYGDLALQVGGVSRIETIKYGVESRGTQTRKRLLRQQQ
jgi:hypothetical protein